MNEYVIKERKFLMIYPDDPFKSRWDVALSLALIFTCLVTPVRTAFVDEDNLPWKITNLVIDIIFFFDMIVSFNSATLD